MDIRFEVNKRLGEGWVVLPVKPGEKATRFPKWSVKDTKVTAADFGEQDNMARRLDGVVDIDCDCAETRLLAASFLPATGMISGRPSLGPSHYWYVPDEPIEVEQFKDTDGSVLVEIRCGNSHYTLVPPSVVMTKGENPQPETLQWFEEHRGPSPVDAKNALRPCVLHLATAALLARHWPSGSRHHAALAAAGFLAARKLNAKTIEAIILGAAKAAGDEEATDRARAAKDTASTFAAGGKTAGGPALEEHMGKDVLAILIKWYGGNSSKFDGLVEEMNGRHFYTRLGKDTVVATLEDNEVVFQKEGALYSWYANQRVPVGSKKKKVKDGDSTRDVDEPTFRSKFEIWREHPGRRQYRTVTFAPPPSKAAQEDYNLWTGFKYDPFRPPEGLYPALPDVGHPERKEAEQIARALIRDWADAQMLPQCHLFFDLAREVICSGNDEYFKYLVDWLAFTVQFPGIPIEICVVMKGKQGAGKGSFARLFGELFGRHFVHLDKTEQLAGKFNALVSGKVVVFADEAFFAGDKRDLGSLKRLITEPTLTIERKGIDGTIEPNHMHLMMATNENWAHQAGEFERRFLTLKVSDVRMQDLDYFNALNKQMKAVDSKRALLTYLMTRVVSHDSVRRVPRTEELRVQQELSLTSEMKWWKDRLWFGSMGIDGTWPEALSADQIFDDYITWCETHKINRRASKIQVLRDDVGPWLGERRRSGAGHVRPIAPLDKARQLWDEKYGITTPWPSQDDDNPGPPADGESKPQAGMPF